MSYIQTQAETGYLSRDDITEIRTRYRNLRKTQYNKDSIHLLSELYVCDRSDIRRIVTSTDFPEIRHSTTRMVLEDQQIIKIRGAKIRLLIQQGFSDKAIARQIQCSTYMVKKQRKEMMRESVGLRTKTVVIDEIMEDLL